MIDPEVVEAAALAHDLGHPPFGHIAEIELDTLVKAAGDQEGYEGNAQSFRIVTRLAGRMPDQDGLDLSRATLNAILKYPWARDTSVGVNGKKAHKFGFYTTEREQFDFARAGFADERQSVEAAIMDLADSIAYSVHDLDDFYRAGIVPLSLLRLSPSEFRWFLEDWKKSLRPTDDIAPGEIDSNADKFLELLLFWPTERQYTGSLEQRKNLRWITSRLIDRYVKAVGLGAPGETPLTLSDSARTEMAFLRRLVRRYVIEDPKLATQQAGQRRVIGALFEAYRDAIQRGQGSLIPAAFRDTATAVIGKGPADPKQIARLTADIVASFSDTQASVLYRRLTGITGGSVVDIIEG